MLCGLTAICAIWMWNIHVICIRAVRTTWSFNIGYIHESVDMNTVKHNFRFHPQYSLGNYILPCTRGRHNYFFISTFHSAHQLRSRPIVPFNCSQCLILAFHVRPQYRPLFDRPRASYWQTWSALPPPPPHMFHHRTMPPPPSCPPASILTGHASSISGRVLGRE